MLLAHLAEIRDGPGNETIANERKRGAGYFVLRAEKRKKFEDSRTNESSGLRILSLLFLSFLLLLLFLLFKSLRRAFCPETRLFVLSPSSVAVLLSLLSFHELVQYFPAKGQLIN